MDRVQVLGVRGRALTSGQAREGAEPVQVLGHLLPQVLESPVNGGGGVLRCAGRGREGGGSRPQQGKGQEKPQGRSGLGAGAGTEHVVTAGSRDSKQRVLGPGPAHTLRAVGPRAPQPGLQILRLTREQQEQAPVGRGSSVTLSKVGFVLGMMWGALQGLLRSTQGLPVSAQAPEAKARRLPGEGAQPPTLPLGS